MIIIIINDNITNIRQVGADTLVFVKKEGLKKHPDYTMEGASPLYYTFRIDGAFTRTSHITLEILSKVLGNSLTTFTFTVKAKPGDIYDRVFDEYRSQTPLEITMTKGKIKTIADKQRTEEQKTYLKCFEEFNQTMKELDKNSINRVAWNAYSPPPTVKVPPLDMLSNLLQALLLLLLLLLIIIIKVIISDNIINIINS